MFCSVNHEWKTDISDRRAVLLKLRPRERRSVGDADCHGNVSVRDTHKLTVAADTSLFRRQQQQQQRPVDPLSLHSGRAKPTALSLNEDTGLNHSCKMDNGRLHLSAQVSRDRVISKFPKWYTPEACLQFKDHFHVQVRNACQDRLTRNVGLKISKVVVVGDLYVGKTCLINRFCKDIFDRDYKATIGVDFEIERFEIAGVPYTLQVWDTAGQEKFKCIASAYYRGAQVIITVFDLADIKTLEHTRQWLEDALKENEPGSCFIFLVGTKKDLVSQAECERTENDAIKMASEMHAEYWSVSAKTGENVQGFFFRLAAIAFEESILKDLEKSNGTAARIGEGDLIKIDRSSAESSQSKGSPQMNLGCC
ncbi:ras-related protein Rab-36-like isoform X1 [Acipenser ruthenus]|uniref:ras-related protein Rab-36-like isoform X1 n=1 Tax=Acipenser ruthenus TaxID=7906 RepID=UPI00145A9A92|nr:ras-related protein Rab-36-like isoform X1 [Acipenser ruthenus]